MKYSLSLLMLFAPVCLANAAEVPPGRVFLASFEDTFSAEAAVGALDGVSEGKPEFTPGRLGRGLLVGDLEGSAAVTYDGSGILDLERGTVCMWVMPVNWKGDDGQNHLLFQAKTEGSGHYLLYKYSSASWGLAFLVDPAEGRRSVMPVYKPVGQWQPGEWHHVACSWTRYDAMRLYIDGKRVASSQGVGLTRQALLGPLRLGGVWGRNGDRTVLDEVMIFGRMLSDQEVAGLAGIDPGETDPGAPADIPGVMLTHAVLGQKVLARVYDDCLGHPARSARLSLTAPDTASVLAQREIPLQPGLNTLEIDLGTVPHGEYEARLTLMREGNALGYETLRVSRETDDTWQTAHDLGREDPVLPPFEPLRVEGNRLDCVGREYTLGGSGLPDQITSRETPLLAAPPAVLIEGEGGRVDLSAGDLVPLEVSQARAEFAGWARGPGVRMDTRVTARYDGTLWFSLKFAPERALDVRSMRIEIPLRAEVAPLYAYNAYGRVDDKRLGYGALPEGQGVIFSREFMPCVWLGSPDLGLGWYAESDEHWDIDGEDALTLEREGDALRLCMNIVRKPRRVAEAFTVEFGLQATPVRPLQADWRSNQWVPSPEITQFFLGLRKRPYPRPEVEGKTPHGRLCYLYTYHSYFTNTLPSDPGEFREMVSRALDHGLFTTPYTDTTFFPELHGDYLMNPEMRTFPGARGTSYGPVNTIDCCHQGPFGDWFVWYVKHLCHEYGVNGIYLDDMSPYGCNNPAHGCGYVGPDGKRRVTYPLRARMETCRRLREMFAATGKPFWITYHISGGRVSPLATYGDALLMAEERNPIVAKNPDYTTNTTSEEWLASFSPEAWGIPAYVLPQFKMNAQWMKDPELAERLLAATVPHDLPVWPLFADTDTLLSARGVLEGFGVGEADVKALPFWHQDTGISYTRREAWITGYLRPGRLLLCASNPTYEPLSVTVDLSLEKLDLPAEVTGIDHRTQARVGVQAGRLTLNLPPKRVQFVEIR